MLKTIRFDVKTNKTHTHTNIIFINVTRDTRQVHINKVYISIIRPT